MLARGFFILFFLGIFMAGSLQAEALTIEKEPPELISLRQAYEANQKQATSQQQKIKMQKKHEAARRDALRAPGYTKQRAALQAARDKELKKINAQYQGRLDQLEANTLAAIDQKNRQEAAAFTTTALNRVHNQYLADLEKLEKSFSSSGKYAGALMVQAERKKVMATPATAAVAAIPAKQVAPPPKPAPKAVAAPTAPPQAPTGKTAANPLTYVSTVRGVAGAPAFTRNNIYAFNLNRLGPNANLVFYAYGKKGTDTVGDVYLTSPDGKRRQVAEWSAKNLGATNFYGVKTYKDVKPVTANIGKYVQQTGPYQVEFVYKDGNEALNIFQVEIHTW